MEKFRKLWGSTLLIAAITALAYLVSIIYQMSYFKAFGIDIGIAGVSISPDDFILPGIIILIGVMMTSVALGIILLITKLSKHIKDINYFAEDIGTIFMFIFSSAILLSGYYHSTVYGFNQNLLRVIDWFFFVGLVMAAVNISAMLLYHVFRKREGTLLRSYIDMRKSAQPSATKARMKARMIKAKESVTIYVFPVYCILAFATVGTDALARRVASETKEFTSIGQNDARDEGAVKLVIGKSGSGLIIKTYDIESKSFNDGYEIIEPQNKSYSTFSIQ